jgi:hypothetical protein
MKCTLFLILFGSFCSKAQLKYSVEYNFSLQTVVFTFNPFRDLIAKNNISFQIQNNKMLYSIGLGREDWHLNYFENYPASSHVNYHCFTYKITPQIEREIMIAKSNFSLRVGIGADVYILNQLRDSLIFSSPTHALSELKPSTLPLLNKDGSSTILDGRDFGQLENYNYIKSMPFALKLNFAFQYDFHFLKVKLFYEPVFIKVNYKSAENTAIEGSEFSFYSNVGIGINYPLNFKKKDQKVTGIE